MRKATLTLGLLLSLLLAASVACRRNQPPAPTAPVAANPAPAAPEAAPIAPPTAPTAAAPAPRPEAADPATFKKLENSWAEAIAAHDRATLEYLLAPEFLITGVGSTADDAVGGRGEWLEKVPDHPWPHHEVLDLHLAEAAPDVMVVKCIWRAEYPPQSITDAGGVVSLLETDVWARRNGRWVVIARHTSLPRPE